jgi:predicted nucleic acid-binding protein
MKYLWDTNIAIYYLQQQFPLRAEKFIDEVIDQEKPCISAITEIELLCWKTINNKDLTTLQGFIKECLVIELEQTIKLKTAEIRKQYHIKLPDAIIAATAIIYNLTLLTRNLSDFKKISQIQVFDPFSLDRV